MEKTVLTEVDIDMSKALSDTIELKKQVGLLKAKMKEAKDTLGETSVEYVQYSAQLKATNEQLRSHENMLSKIVEAENSEKGSLDQLRAKLSVVSKEWASLSEIERLNTERGKKLTDQKTALTEAIKAEEIATGDARRNVGNYEQAVIPLKQQLKEIVQQMQRMVLEGKDNGEEFQQLAVKAGQLKDAMSATNDQVRSFTAGDSMELSLKASKSGFDAMIGSAQAYEGVMQAIGIGNEDVTKGIQKMVALQSIQNGVTQVYEALQKESALTMGINAIKTKLAAASQAIYTTAVGTSTGALKVFRTALLATGIGAIVVAIGLLVTNWDKLTRSMSASAREAKKVNDELETIKQLSEQQISFDSLKLRIKKELGAAESELTKEEIAQNKNRQSELESQIELLSKLKVAGQANADQEKELADDYIKLQQLKDDAIILSLHYEKTKKEEDVKAAEKEAEAVKKAEEKKKKAADDAREAKEKADKEAKDKAEKELEDKRKAAEESVKIMENEMEEWKIRNKSKLDNSKDLTRQMISDEEKRLSDQNAKETEILKTQLSNKLITQSDYNLAVLKLEDEKNVAISALNDAFNLQESDKEKQRISMDYENANALLENQLFGQFEIKKREMNRQKNEELKNAEKVGASKLLIEKKYAKAEKAIEMAKRDAKLALAQGTADNLATIFGKSTAVGKAAAVAATTIETYRGAQAAYTGMVEAIPGPVGIAAGLVAAAASVAVGIANVKKILSVNTSASGSGGEPSSSEAVTATSSAASSSLVSTQTSVGNGIISRDVVSGDSSSQKSSTVLVVDDVTKAQNAEVEKVKASTL